MPAIYRKCVKYYKQAEKEYDTRVCALPGAHLQRICEYPLCMTSNWRLYIRHQDVLWVNKLRKFFIHAAPLDKESRV